MEKDKNGKFEFQTIHVTFSRWEIAMQTNGDWAYVVTKRSIKKWKILRCFFLLMQEIGCKYIITVNYKKFISDRIFT